MPEDETQIVPVDIDLIKRLRFEGRNIEANDMVRAYQENMKKNWKGVRRQMSTMTNKIRVHKLKVKNLCTWCGEEKEESRKDYVTCLKCKERCKKNRLINKIKKVI